MRTFVRWIVFVAVLFSLLAWPAWGHQDAAAQEQVVRLTLDDLGYQALTLRGMYGADEIWLPFASEWAFQSDATFSLVYTASPLLNESRSTLTVLVNDLEVLSIHPQADGLPHREEVTIPLNRLGGKGLAIRFQAYARLTDQACEETNNPGQWIVIEPETAVTLQPGLDVTPPDLAALADVLAFQTPKGTPPAVLFVLPDQPDETVLQLAAISAARLAQQAGNFPADGWRVVYASEVSDRLLTDANLVLLGTPDANPWIEQAGDALPVKLAHGRFQTADGLDAPDEDGLLAAAISPWNPARRLVVMSANGADGLQKLLALFQDEWALQQLQGQFQFVSDLPQGMQVLPERPWLGETTSFLQLGDRDRTVRGIGTFNEWFFFRRPPGWLLDKGAQLTLDLAFSPVLRAQESYVAVFINDVFVGSLRTGDVVGQTRVTFDLPVDKLNQNPDGSLPQALTVRVQIGNYLAEANCEQTHPDAAWTRIYATSFFTMPHVYLAQPDLQGFPYPFVSDANLAPVILAVPDEPTSAEISAALQVAAAIGRYAPRLPEMTIRPAGQVSSVSDRDAHLLILGTRDRQPLINAFLERMGEIPGYRGERGLYQALNSPYEGLLREGPSPWNPERVVLLAFGETEFGFTNAVTVLTGRPPVVKRPGSVALVKSDGQVQVLYRSIDAAPGQKPGEVLREPVLPKPQSWQVVSLILLAAGLAVALIIWLAMRRRS